MEDDFNYPQTWRSNLAIDQELPNEFVATVEGIFSSVINDVVFRNENLEQDGEDFHGRPLYGEPISFSPVDRTTPIFASIRNEVDDRFTNAINLDNTNQGYEGSLTFQLQRQVAEGLSGSVSYTWSRATSVNNATSSRAISNWQFNESVDINDPELRTSDFERRHRVLANLNYRFEWGDRYATSIGAIYEGQSGQPFSWIYVGDAQGDGESFNDLVFVPENEDDIVLVSDNWNAMDSFIESEDGLSPFRGDFVDRNSARDPFQHIFDIRVNQEIATFSGQSVELTATVENVLNLLNDDWGRIRFSSFNDNTAWDFTGRVSEDDIGLQFGDREVTEDDIGKPFISFDEQTAEERAADEFLNVADLSSRWRLQVGARYTF